ncbi:MAG: M15 family metallopeptidase [Cytophagaceae bacterium]
MHKITLVIIFILIISACGQDNRTPEQQMSEAEITQTDTSAVVIIDTPEELNQSSVSLSDSDFVVMSKYASGFSYDMKYATEDNFLKKKVYSCSECLLRKAVADALIKVNEVFRSMGYSIKFYDCYRPVDVQKKMWEIYPDDRYVGNPNKSGSIHNRGGAVDITLVDAEGNELDMGTAFDHFGVEAHHKYSNLPKEVLENRRILKETMEANGFSSITSEWWHYNYQGSKKYALSNFMVECK